MIVFPNLTVDEIHMLDRADTADKWRAAVNKVLLAREGNYPPDWNERVVRVPADTVRPPTLVYDHMDQAAGF